MLLLNNKNMESNYMNLFLLLITTPNCNGRWLTHTSCIELHFLTRVHFISITFCPSSYRWWHIRDKRQFFFTYSMMHVMLSNKILRVVSNFLPQSNSNFFYKISLLGQILEIEIQRRNKISLLGKTLEIEIQRRNKTWSNPL